ncbi:MAG: ATP-binding protein [Bacteroidota bacterium]
MVLDYRVKRKLLQELRNHLDEPEITLVIGPRQAGKTTLLKQLASEQEAVGKPSLFLNLDFDQDSSWFTSQSLFLKRLALKTADIPHTVFIDEIQRLENAGLFLKGIYDKGLKHKLVVTGSGSLELKEKIAESLVGRKRNFRLLTVGLKEFINYRTAYEYEESIQEFLLIHPMLANSILEEYMNYGGYPRVVTAESERDKNQALNEIYQGYIERDIQALLQLNKSVNFVTLLQILANRVGYSINYASLSNQVGLSTPTLKNYLWYSEKTFITASVTPFFRNKEKEISKAPQHYFIDLGLRNFLLGQYENPMDQGMRFENLVYRLLEQSTRDSVARIHFWRTQNQAEVDFVIDKGYDLLPVEVKSAEMKKPKMSRSFRAFIEKYAPKEAWLINKSLKGEEKLGNTWVKFLPWWELL